MTGLDLFPSGERASVDQWNLAIRVADGPCQPCLGTGQGPAWSSVWMIDGAATATTATAAIVTARVLV